MHSDPAQFELSAAPSLRATLARMAERPGYYTPLAGGTELMVAFNAGRLTARSLLSIQHLPELRFLRVQENRLELGAGTTFTDLRNHHAIAEGWPLLAQSASWTGSIANQNRATVGGNLCNASPAADTPPALLAYDAELTLVHAGGTRTLPYRDFHLGYKQTALRPEELLYSISVPSIGAGQRQYLRKVGTRNAQAISKIALAAVLSVEDGHIEAIRLGAASLADRPLRLHATELALTGRPVHAEALETTVRLARAALAGEAKPIDDIRSTARYRSAVAANLLEQFLRQAAAEALSQTGSASAVHLPLYPHPD